MEIISIADSGNGAYAVLCRYCDPSGPGKRVTAWTEVRKVAHMEAEVHARVSHNATWRY